MATLSTAHGLDFAHRIAHFRLHHLAVLHQGLAKGGDAHPEASTFQQAHAQGFFKRLDAFGQGGLGNVQRRSGFGHVAQTGGRQEELNFSVIHNPW